MCVCVCVNLTTSFEPYNRQIGLKKSVCVEGVDDGSSGYLSEDPYRPVVLFERLDGYTSVSVQGPGSGREGSQEDEIVVCLPYTLSLNKDRRKEEGR